MSSSRSMKIRAGTNRHFEEVPSQTPPDARQSLIIVQRCDCHARSPVRSIIISVAAISLFILQVKKVWCHHVRNLRTISRNVHRDSSADQCIGNKGRSHDKRREQWLWPDSPQQTNQFQSNVILDQTRGILTLKQQRLYRHPLGRVRV